jgi:hypothetical protein
MLMRVGLGLLVTPEALPRIVTKAACSLMMVIMLSVMRSRVKAMVLCMML